MNADYRYLRRMGECGPVLMVMAQNPETLMGRVELWQCLRAHAGELEGDISHLLEYGFIESTRVPVEGHPRQFRVMFQLTAKGREAVGQLDT